MKLKSVDAFVNLKDCIVVRSLNPLLYPVICFSLTVISQASTIFLMTQVVPTTIPNDGYCLSLVDCPGLLNRQKHQQHLWLDLRRKDAKLSVWPLLWKSKVTNGKKKKKVFKLEKRKDDKEKKYFCLKRTRHKTSKRWWNLSQKRLRCCCTILLFFCKGWIAIVIEL